MRVALINIQGADDPTLVSGLFKEAFGKEVEVKVFTSDNFGDKAVENSAAFVLERTAAGFSGEGNRAVLSRNATEAETRKARKMESTGLAVEIGFEDFDSSRSIEDQRHWIKNGSYPVQADEQDFSSLFADDEPEAPTQEDFFNEQEAPAAPAPAPAPVETQRSSSGIPIEGGLEDIPLPGVRTAPKAEPESIEPDEAPVYPQRTRVRETAPAPIQVDDEDDVPAPVFRSHPTDSMSVNGELPRRSREVPVADAPQQEQEDFEAAPIPRRREAAVEPEAPARRIPEPINLGEDDEDDNESSYVIPTRRSAPAPAPAPAVNMPSWDEFNSSQEDVEEAPLPVRRSAPVQEYQESEAVLPARRERRAEAPETYRPAVDLSDEKDDELPPAPVRRREAPAPIEFEQDEAPAYTRREEAPAPRRVAPILVEDPYEAPRPAPRYVAQDEDGGRNRMADEVDLSALANVGAQRQANAERQRQRREAEERQEAAAPVERIVPTPVQEDRDEIPETFRRRNVLEEDAFPERGMRPKRSMIEEMQAEFGSSAGKFVPASDSAFIIYVTGSRGGAGKSTVAFLLAQTLATACRKAGRGEEVYLVEGDYENPKLGQRLGLQRSQNLGELARFYESIQQDRSLPGGSNRFETDSTTRNIIDKIAYEMPDSGLKVLACPYDLTTRKSTTIRLAMSKAITQVSRTARYIVIDGDTLSNDDVLDRELITKAHHTMIIAWGNSEEDMGDGLRSIHTLRTPEANGGMGIPAKRVSMFFNRTNYAKVEEIKVKIRPHSVSGYIPELEAFKDTWIGSVEPSNDFLGAVTCVAKAANVIYPNEDLVPFVNRQFSKSAPGTTSKRGILGNLFGRRG